MGDRFESAQLIMPPPLAGVSDCFYPHHQHVINHQGRRGEQTCESSEVLARHRIRTAACRISLNRQAIGEVNHCEHTDSECGSPTILPAFCQIFERRRPCPIL